MKNNPLLLLAGAGVLLYFLSKGNAAKNLKILFQNIKFEKSKGFNFPVVIVNFKIINPTNTPLQIQNIVGDLYINDKLFSTVSQSLPVNIPSNNQTYYSVKIETGIVQALSSVMQLLNKKQKLVVKFKGSANSTGFNIPIEQTVIQL